MCQATKTIGVMTSYVAWKVSNTPLYISNIFTVIHMYMRLSRCTTPLYNIRIRTYIVGYVVDEMNGGEMFGGGGGQGHGVTDSLVEPRVSPVAE